MVPAGNKACSSRYTGETKRNEEVRMKIIIQLKVQSHQNIFKATSTTVLHWLSFQMLQKVLRPGRTQKLYILLSAKLILTNKKTLIDQLYLEMVSHRAINDMIQTPLKKKHFFFTSMCCIAFNCCWQFIFDKKF